MGTVLTTKDGENHIILSDEDFVNLIDEYMGHDAKVYFDRRIFDSVFLYNYLEEIGEQMYSLYSQLDELIHSENGAEQKELQSTVKNAFFVSSDILTKLQTIL